MRRGRQASVRRFHITAVCLIMTGIAGIAFAAKVAISIPEEGIDFKPGPNVELVRETCNECHSADYVAMQPRLDRTGWQKVVTKMVDKFKMPPPSPDQLNAILNYLTLVYGN